MKFLENLINFDKDNIPVRVMDKLKHQILNDENFDPDKVKTASTAAEGNLHELKYKKSLSFNF